MGAKKRSVTAARSPSPINSDADLPFKLGEQVLCRYSSYPYWPATIDRSHQTRVAGKYFKHCNRKSAGPILTFWCTFANEDTGGWVRVDRIARYHPSLAERIRVPSDHAFYEEQCKAIEAANRDFETLGVGIDIPDVPSDFDKDENDDDDLEIPESEQEEEDDQPEENEKKEKGRGSRGRTAGRKRNSTSKSSNRKRKRKSYAGSSGRQRKRRNTGHVDEKVDEKVDDTGDGMIDDKVDEMVNENVHENADENIDVNVDEKVDRTEDNKDGSNDDAKDDSKDDAKDGNREVDQTNLVIKDLRAQLSAANDAASALRRTLRKREQQILEMSGCKHPLRISLPSAPAPLDVEIPPEDERRIRKMSNAEFSKVFLQIKSDFEHFKVVVDNVNATRAELDGEIERVQPNFVRLVRNVADAESQAAETEQRICDNLKRILQGDIDLEALREHKAGVFVRSLGRQCKAMAVLSELCTTIYSTWKAQVATYVTEQEALIRKEAENESRPGSTMEKTQRKNVGDDGGPEVTSQVAAERKTGTGSKGAEEGKMNKGTKSDELPKDRAYRVGGSAGTERGCSSLAPPKVKKNGEESTDGVKTTEDDHGNEKNTVNNHRSAESPQKNVAEPVKTQLSDQKGSNATHSREEEKSKRVAETDEDGVQIDSEISAARQQTEASKAECTGNTVLAKAESAATDEAQQEKSNENCLDVGSDPGETDQHAETSNHTSGDEVQNRAIHDVSDIEKIFDPTDAGGNEKKAEVESSSDPPGGGGTKAPVSRKAVPRQHFKREEQERQMALSESLDGVDRAGTAKLETENRRESDHSMSAGSPESTTHIQSKQIHRGKTLAGVERDEKGSDPPQVTKESETEPNSEEMPGFKRRDSQERKVAEGSGQQDSNLMATSEGYGYNESKRSTDSENDFAKNVQPRGNSDKQQAERMVGTVLNDAPLTDQSMVEDRAGSKSASKPDGCALKNIRESLTEPGADGKPRGIGNEKSAQTAPSTSDSARTNADTPRSVTVAADSVTMGEENQILPAAGVGVHTETETQGPKA